MPQMCDSGTDGKRVLMVTFQLAHISKNMKYAITMRWLANPNTVLPLYIYKIWKQENCRIIEVSHIQ
jgi:hypothetical protein